MKILIIVDMQKGFINNSNKHLIGHIENLLQKQYFDEIFATKFINHPASQYVKYINWEKMKRSELSEFAINLPEKTKVIEKETYALKDRMFSGDKFKVGKKEFSAKCSEVYIVGTDYDACVLSIGYQLFDHGFQPHFIMDCIGSAAKSSSISKIQFMKLCERIFGENSVIKD